MAAAVAHNNPKSGLTKALEETPTASSSDAVVNGTADETTAAEQDAPSSSSSPSSSKSPDTTTPPAAAVATIESPLSVKHPLQNSWTLWFDNPGKKASQSSWSDNLKKVLTFSTVEDFWGLYNNIVPASKLVPGSNYHLFKEGIQPCWEDRANMKGGKWVANVPPKQRNSDLDKRWLWTILACVGEAFPAADQVCGVVVSIRIKQDRLSLWTNDATDRLNVTAIGQHFKTHVIELPSANKLTFQSHEDALKRDSSFNNPYRYEV